MKFLTTTDKYLFLNEIERTDLFPLVSEEWNPDSALVELFLQKRKKLIGGLKDFRKSQNAKASWRRNKYKHLSGLRTFHKSTAGKRFHRSLGNFLMRHDFSGNRPAESYHQEDLHEFIKAMASARTHGYIETEFYHSITESAEYDLFLEEMITTLNDMEYSAITNGLCSLTEQQRDYLYWLTESTAQIKAFADASGKSIETVDKYWIEIKTALLKDGKSEDDEGFWGLLVSILKKKLALK